MVLFLGFFDAYADARHARDHARSSNDVFVATLNFWFFFGSFVALLAVFLAQLKRWFFSGAFRLY